MSHNEFVKAPWKSFTPTHIPVAGNTTNLGDDVQSAAAKRLWGVESYVDRDKPRSWPKGAIVPLCGWYGHHQKPFPVSSDAVIIGFHCANGSVRNLYANRDWLAGVVRNQGFPAFCRDTRTRDLIRSMGIEAELGGCVSLTLSPYTGPREGEMEIDYQRKQGSLGKTHVIKGLPSLSLRARVAVGEQQLQRLERATAVRTSRLHAWLPSLALGTPAQLDLSTVTFERIRFSGYNVEAQKRADLFPASVTGYHPSAYLTLPGWFDFADVYTDIADRIPEGGTFVELGVFNGRSLCFMAEYLRSIGKSVRVVGVDLFERTELKDVQASFDRIGGGIELIQSDSAGSADLFQAGSVDAVFVDAGHSEEDVFKDIMSWLPKLKPNGVMAGHDYTKAHPGVIAAVGSSGIDFELRGKKKNVWAHDLRPAVDTPSSES